MELIQWLTVSFLVACTLLVFFIAFLGWGVCRIANAVNHAQGAAVKAILVAEMAEKRALETEDSVRARLSTVAEAMRIYEVAMNEHFGVVLKKEGR